MKDNKYIIPSLIAVAIIMVVIGSTFAYWNWQSTNAQKTNVTFTVGANFSCSADGGGTITNTSYFVPTDCTNTTYAIQRTVKVSTTQGANTPIYLNMNLKVNSIGSGLSGTTNFKYALTTSSTSCETGLIASGNFYGATTNTEIPLLTDERYLTSTTDDTYYLYVWLDKAETSSSTMNQSVSLSLTGDCTDQEPAKTYALWGAEVDKYTRVNFSQTSEQNGTNGLYVLKGTQNDTYPIYYYRGAVTDNNVLFGGFCWKIVRTTNTGGTKLIYNGLPSGTNNDQCTNTTGTDTQLSTTSKFNNTYQSPADVGYMYGTRYAYTSRTSSNLATSYKYGNSFTYDGTNYHLVDTIDSTGTWATDYSTLNNNHYTCFNTTGTCSSIKYIYYASSGSAAYITMSNGKSVENVIDEMLTNSSNTTSSTIKTIIDTWYSTNMTSYTSNLEDTIWCNDRSISRLGGWDPNGGGMTQWLYFNSNTRLYTTYSPRLVCANNDSFTVSNANGNGALTYPVGLLTTDEIMMTGGKGGSGTNSSYYLYTERAYWTGSPSYFYSGIANGFIGSSMGFPDSSTMNNAYGVRPAVSLKLGATWSGSGTNTDPYTVSYN